MVTIVLPIIGAAIGLFLFALHWGRDDNLEKYYQRSAQTLMKKGYYPPDYREVQTSVIVDTGQKLSPLRTFLKKALARLRGRRVPPVILVFGKESEEEQQVYLIEQAVGVELRALQLLDADFIESAIDYYAYKFSSEEGWVNKKVEYLLRKKFEKCPFRECITRLDDPDFSALVVLNPPPEKKPLMQSTILPMIHAKDSELRVTSALLPEKEKFKSIFMKICTNLSWKTWAVLFIGELCLDDYLSLFGERIHRVKGYILAARGTRILPLSNLCDEIVQRSLDKWDVQFDVTSIEGEWQFVAGNRVRCCWRVMSKVEK